MVRWNELADLKEGTIVQVMGNHRGGMEKKKDKKKKEKYPWESEDGSGVPSWAQEVLWSDDGSGTPVSIFGGTSSTSLDRLRINAHQSINVSAIP